MMVPLAYIALKLGAPAESVFVVEFFVTLASILIQLKIISPMISLPKRGYLKNVFGRSLLVTILSLPLPIFIANCLTDNIVNTFIIMFFTVLSVLIATYLLGLESHERKIANRKFVVFLHKISTFVQR